MKNLKKKGAALILTTTILTGAIGVNAFSKSFSEIPVTNTITYTFENREITEKGAEANIENLKISGFKNKEFEKKLNDKFLSLSESILGGFMNNVEEMSKDTEKVMLSEILDFQIKTDTSSVLSIDAVTDIIMASSNEIHNFYNIDKKNEKLITLSDLFKDDSYISVISDYIKSEMASQMKQNENIAYFTKEDMSDASFDKITSSQNFYINSKGQLVIVFDKYAVAPGYMGTVEFTIPTEKIEGILNETNLLY